MKTILLIGAIIFILGFPLLLIPPVGIGWLITGGMMMSFASQKIDAQEKRK